MNEQKNRPKIVTKKAAASAPANSGDPAPERDGPQKEIGGRKGPEPTRYGDWENNGIASDF